MRDEHEGGPLVAQGTRDGEEAVDLVPLDGAVESAVRLGVADAIADVVETGTTLRNAGLEALAVTPEGDILTMPEQWESSPPMTPVWRFRDGTWSTAFRLPRDGVWAPVGADVGPDGKLYVPQGAPCNVCLKDRDRFGLIGRMNPDGSHYEVVARGIRNTVGFAWHPVTHELWFTDNGRDLMGDDVPDDKLNRAPRVGMDFGFPYCHGGDTPDPEFGKDHPCSAFTPPVVKLGAHVASLGMRFYTGSMFPGAYRDNIFIAEHGSWNRSKKVGYRVVRVITNPDGSNAHQEVFAEGWLQPGETVWGRPADVQPMPDGSLLISDDYAGAVYRVTYSTP